MTKKPLPDTIYESILKPLGLDAIKKDAFFLASFKKNDYLTRGGHTQEYFYIILKGSVKVFYTSEESKVLLYTFATEGDVLGEIELFSQEECSLAENQAINEVDCVAISLLQYRDELLKSTTFAAKMTKILAKRIAIAGKTTTLAPLYTAENRLCSYINWTNNNLVFYEKPMQLAQLIGTTYRHLHRLLAKLCKEGILEKKEKQYFIINEKELLKRSCDYYSLGGKQL